MPTAYNFLSQFSNRGQQLHFCGDLLQFREVGIVCMLDVCMFDQTSQQGFLTAVSHFTCVGSDIYPILFYYKYYYTS